MSREPEQSDDSSASTDKVLEADDLLASIERSQSLQRQALEVKFGPDVRLLAEDEDKLFTYLQSEDLSLKRVALLCLLYFHKMYPEKIVREVADYLVNGVDIGIRSLCDLYLAVSRNEEVTSILDDCASKLRAREARPGDDVVIRCVISSLESIYGGPKPLDDIVSIAERIVARLESANERNDSAGQATPPQASESDQGI